jgi:hypothetical protein
MPHVPVADEVRAARLQRLISASPTFGSRRLRVGAGFPINRKAAYRVLPRKGWFVRQRTTAARPAVRRWIAWANTERPSQGLGSLSPQQDGLTNVDTWFVRGGHYTPLGG